MKQFLLFLFLLVYAIPAAYSQRHVSVKGYYRKDGTYVRPHYRTAPNSTNRDNFSTQGNVTPYTGKRGWIRPDNKAPSSRRSDANSSPTNTTVRRRVSDTNKPTHHYEQKKVGRYPDGYVYAIIKSNGQLWQTPHQLNRIQVISKSSFVKVLGYEDNFWKVEWDGTIGYAHQVLVEMNNDMVPFKTEATSRRRLVERPTYAVSTTQAASNPMIVEYAPLLSAQPGNCTVNDQKRLIDPRYVVKGTYLMNRPQGKPMLKLNFGDKVNIICDEENWYEVAYQGATGWIEGRLLRK